MANITKQQKTRNYNNILFEIRRNYFGITTTELANELGMGKRTLWRYLDTLRKEYIIYQDSIYWFCDNQNLTVST